MKKYKIIRILIILIIIPISICLKGQLMDDSCIINSDTMKSTYKWYFDIKPVEFSKVDEKAKRDKVYIVVDPNSIECGISVTIFNLTNKKIIFESQDGNIQAIREAKDAIGIWRPIEYWRPSWCGNSYGWETIQPNEFMYFEAVKYTGDFKTKVRFKIKLNNQLLYSDSYNGSINRSQFKKPKWCKKINFFK